MLKNTAYTNTVIASNLFVSTLTSILAFAASAQAASPHLYEASVSVSCRSAMPLDADGTWRSAGASAGEDHCFQIDFSSRGILSLDLSTPGPAARGRLDVVARNDSGITFVQRSATSLLLAVRQPGSYHVRVVAEDSRLPLPSYKLSTFFVEEKVSSKNEEDGESDPDPDPLLSCTAPSTKNEEDGESDPDPDPVTHCPYDLSVASSLLRFKLAALCEGVDDHGDTFKCATPVGSNQAAAGEIDNAWGDDEDFFSFQVTGYSTVEIASDGETDTFGELYDRFGHRLGSDDEGAGDGNFRLVRTLAPGTYFVRVEGANGASGAYSITVRELQP